MRLQTTKALNMSFLGQVYKCKFWMWHYSARTPKPTMLWSASAAVTGFWLRKLKRAEVLAAEKERNPAGAQAPCRHYKDSEGQAKFQGTDQLQITGSPPKWFYLHSVG